MFECSGRWFSLLHFFLQRLLLPTAYGIYSTLAQPLFDQSNGLLQVGGSVGKIVAIGAQQVDLAFFQHTQGSGSAGLVQEKLCISLHQYGQLLQPLRDAIGAESAEITLHVGNHRQQILLVVQFT